jgi:hypothetical protein
MFFVEQSIKFDGKPINYELIPSLSIPDAKFGLLNFKAITAPLTDKKLEILFTIDCSGSMSDKCSDGRTKMQHIIHTLKNMMIFFKENPSLKIYVTINAFDDLVYNIVDRILIAEDNFLLIISKIDQIMPRASTNIEVALSHVKAKIAQITTEHPTHEVSHIFMTDGEATSGSQDYAVLARIVDRSIANNFIGFGIDHDSALLNTVGAGSYYFIDKLENAGFVYGEILNNIVYKLLVNVSINVINGLIYDFKNNVWGESLSVGEIISESNKMYHIASNNPAECFVMLGAQTAANNINIEITIDHGEEDADLAIYIYRQRTLQLLFQVNNFFTPFNISNANFVGGNELKGNVTFGVSNAERCKKTNIQDYQFNNFRDCNFSKDEAKLLKEQLKSYLKEMKQFMIDNNFIDDKLMKNLCDDIYICYRTFGTRFGAMYVEARQTSQGTQRLYTVSHTPEDDNNNNNNNNKSSSCTPMLKRTYKRTVPSIQIDSNEEAPEELEHNLSNIDDAPYLTPMASSMMRALSSGSEPKSNNTGKNELEDL